MMKGAEEVPAVQKKNFSSLPLRWKSLLAIFIIGIVILASISYGQYASYSQLSKDYSTLGASSEKMQLQNQQLLSGNSSADEAMNIIKNVFPDRYLAISSNSSQRERGTVAGMEGIVEEVLTYSLVNNASNINVVLTFRNGNFSLFQLNLIEGVTDFAPIYTQPQPMDFLATARDVIARYASTENESYLSEMSQLLSVANETQQDQTLGNIKLETSINGDNASSCCYTRRTTPISQPKVSK